MNKKVFIAGATKGIGLQLAKDYLEDGYEVGLCGRDLSTVPEELSLSSKCKIFKADISDYIELRKILSEFSGKGLNILIVCAGCYFYQNNIPSSDSSLEKAYETISTNVIGVFNCFEIGMQFLEKNGSGQLVAISSISGLLGLPKTPLYSATKSAIIKLCEGYSIALEKDKISVTSLLPGPVDTVNYRKYTRGKKKRNLFLLSEKESSKIIRMAIANKNKYKIFPKFYALAIPIIQRLPRKMYLWVIRRFLFEI